MKALFVGYKTCTNYTRNNTALAFLISVFCFCMPTNAAAYTIDDNPDWVIERQSPPANEKEKYLARNGKYYRLFDKQINAINPREQSVYYATEIALTNKSGVSSGSTIEINYDPNYESVVIHQLGIIRNGRYLDRLSTTSFEELRTEQQLDELLYNGTTTLAAILEDVRVGDVIRHAYSIEGTNPVFGDIVEYGMGTQHYVSSGVLAYRLSVDSNTAMFVRKNDFDGDISETQFNGVTIYNWSARNTEKLKYVDNEPAWTQIAPSFSISSVENWQDIVKWSLPHYNKSAMQSEQIKAIARRIMDEHDTDHAYAGAALQWVQDEIRYFGVELGENSHNPSHPDLTLTRRFGDCKDKAVLLIALLNELGIDSQPALVNTNEKLRNENYIHRLHAFNHVIVHVEMDGVSHWIDPTIQYQSGNLGEFYEPDFGFALLIDEQTTGLKSMANLNEIFTLKLHKNISISADNNDWANLSIRTERMGYSAESQRRTISNRGIENLSEAYLDYYRNIHDSIEEAETLRFVEFPKNRNITFEKYEMSDVWNRNDSDKSYFEVSTEQIQDYLETPNASKYRTRPYALGHPVKIQESTKILLAQTKESGSYKENVANDYFDYKLFIHQTKDTNSLLISHSLTLKARSVPASDLLSYIEDVEKVKDFLSWYPSPTGLTWSDKDEKDTVESEHLTDNGISVDNSQSQTAVASNAPSN